MFAAQARESECAGSSRAQEKGYILLTMLLVIALMAIFATAALPAFKFVMQRDQEEELIHRGVQYTRAIRAYYKKTGRYPTRLEDLENTNNLRFLRKRYKDPITRRDFRLLHFGEPGVKLTLSGGFNATNIPGASPIGAPGGMSGSGPSSSGFGNSAFGSSGFGNSGVNSSGVFSQSSGPGGNSGGFAASSNSQTPSGQPGTTPASDPSQAVSQTSSQPGSTGQGDASSGSQQIVTGGPIVGVASISKNDTIREFNHKKKYDEWQFLYDPALDRGGLITTPTQPALATFGTQPGQNMQPGSTNGNSSTPFSGLSNNPNPGGSTPPVQPPANPPQQQ
jgi:type II secretory pathway pseudopilin PulG